MIYTSLRNRTLILLLSGLAGSSLVSCGSTPGREQALDPVMAVATSPDGRTLAASTDMLEVALFDVSPLKFRSLLTPERGTLSAKERRTLLGYMGVMRSPPLAFSPDGKLLVAADVSKEVVGWDMDSGAVRFRAPVDKGVADVAFFPDGRSFVTAGPALERWSAADGSKLGAFRPNAGATVTSVAIAPDGATLLAGLSNGEIVEFDSAMRQASRVLKGHASAVTGIAFAPDGFTFASTAGRYDPRIWKLGADAPVPRTLAETHSMDQSAGQAAQETQSVAFLAWLLGTARGFQIVGAPTMGPGPSISPVLERAARTPSPACELKVAYSPDGRYLAATAHLPALSGDFQVYLVDLVRKEGRTITGIKGCSVAFSQDSKFVITGGLGAPELWNAQTGTQVVQ